jgi:hypothetical protein
MPIPDQVVAGDSGHIQDHNDISNVLTGYESRIGQLETDFDLLPATADIATESYVDSAVSTAVSNLIESAPSALNTLDELAQALGDDANFATTVTNSLSQKQPLDADLTAIAGLSGTSGILRKTAADTWALDTTNFAATSYVDSSISTALNSYLPLAGGTLTGQINGTTGSFSGNVSAANPTQNGHLATKSYVDSVAAGTLSNSITINAGTGLSGGGQVTLGNSVTLNNSGVLSVSGTTNQISASTVNGATTLSFPNDVTITGNVTASNPTLSSHLATKSYVDTAVAGVPRALATVRGTWTGSIASSVESAVVGVITITFPVGRFTQTPLVMTQNVDDGSASRMVYARFTPYSVSTSSVSLQVVNNAPPATVAGGGDLTKAIVDITAIQMTSGSSYG